jgi:ribosomal-protein-alanine N-acetyltransferase
VPTTTRLLKLDDASELLDLVTANREFLKPWEPVRQENYFTLARQRELVAEALSAYESGSGFPLVIHDRSGAMAGRINISGIIRGAFHSANLGYWVAQSVNGRGIATRAVKEAAAAAFNDLGLHRLQAGTLLHNLASQRVLTGNGFTPIGIAERYLKIDGQWQDHILFQLIRPEAEDA